MNKNNQHGTPMYLRDLNPTMQDDFITLIKKTRPDLINVILDNNDVIIGEYFDSCEEYKKA